MSVGEYQNKLTADIAINLCRVVSKQDVKHSILRNP